MNKKLVNCIIPVYNVGRYLVDAVDSITHQTIGFDNINLVIINDGSTDNSQEVIESLRFLYPSIVVITQENQGVSAARNAGLDFCFENFSAPYTCFIDGDDKYDPNHLETLIAFFKEYEKRMKNSKYWMNKLFLMRYLFQFVHLKNKKDFIILTELWIEGKVGFLI
ncbi:glycosyltransferase family 2 protein [Lactococcus lactis]|uniref:glycosyltransferase family 2 protein n=1 Tax=Lactococcus lactis TaxID=1358 RepID=UPI0018A9B9A3|nr:glycosyltransferase family A protein [Lactococcus lactis]